MAARRVVIAMASPRKDGNSTILAHKVADGATAAGAEVELFKLHEMDIKPCDGCDACQQKKSKGCIVKDDMQLLYPILRQADTWIIASPIYWFTFSAQAKVFMDRWYGLGAKPDDEPEGIPFKDKRIGIVLTYGDSDPVKSGAINAIRTFQDAFRYCGVRTLRFVYGSASAAGEIRSNQELLDNAYSMGKELGGV